MAAIQPDRKDSDKQIGAGTILAGKYKVTREVGRGGMAAVYEAEHVAIGKRVAVKVLAAELTSSTIVVERFLREARAAASVHSPYIVDVYDSGKLDDGRPFIAMELLHGESLYERMARVRLLDQRTTARIIGQVAKGLTKAHAAGVVHRDLKPENIHLTPGEDGGEEVAKILDFGLAKFYAPVAEDEKAARLTREGAVFGTPAYMSPEQVKGHGTVDHRSDLWALGCMAYECLIGRPVWNTEQGVAMTFAAVAAAPIPLPSKMRPDLPLSFDEWFEKALQRDPDRRFQSARELADALAVSLDVPPVSFANMGSLPSKMELDSRGSMSGEARTSGASVRSDGLRAVASGSGTDLPPSVAGEGPPPPASAPSKGGSRFLLTTVLIGCAIGGAGVVYTEVLRPRSQGAGLAPHPAAVPAASAAPSTSAAASASATPLPLPPEQARWLSVIEEGQDLLAKGDADGAMRRFKDAADSGAGAVARSFLDNVKLGAATGGPCKMMAFSHPRFGLSDNAGRPAAAATSKGLVVAWTDDHEQPGHDHVYSVLLDAAGRPTSTARDLTPEAEYAVRPSLMTVGDRVALLFWDRSGREPGVKVRWLDADGRIGGMSASVGASKPGYFWPAMDRMPDGSGFWVAWQENRDKEWDDLFLRRLDADLVPQGGEVRATRYEPERGKLAKISVPGIAAAKGTLFLTYAVERDHKHLVDRMRLPLAMPELTRAAAAEKAGKGPRELGDTLVVSEDKVGSDYPMMACAKDACFLVWHELEKNDAQAALIDPARGNMLWRKRFATKGGHPAVAASADGRADVAYYDGGTVRIAEISRDGLGPTSAFAKVTGEQPRPYVAPGAAPGEWLVSWLDLEAGHLEPFVARLQCHN